MPNPPDRRYAPTHEWVSLDGEVATVGITEFAQDQLGDVVFVELPDLGEQLRQGETFGVIESVKAAVDLVSPVSGEVVDRNTAILDDPALVNSSPFGDGWMLRIRVERPDELDNLLDAGAYGDLARAD